ncbi:MAG: hypothetical protein K0R39_3052 [Symbiobacteriaceae bacterium]|nr:hypothetical protein [Symbiobacteriaceae bacterium]
MASTRNTDELIITGSPEAVRRLQECGKSAGETLHEQRRLTIGHKARNLDVALVKTNGSARSLADRLADLARADRLAVKAEANCPTGHPNGRDRGARGWNLNPWAWGEDPWAWGEDPWAWGEDPWAWGEDALPLVMPAGATPAEGEALFWQQGAFQKIGLTDGAGQRLPALANHQGEGVLVGIFDAMPAQAVSYPWLTLHPANVPGEGPWDDRDISDHGIFCASLVHAVAPKAQVHLYEACGKDGHGRLFPLLEAIEAFVALAAGKPAVLSLSLGSLCVDGSAALRALLQKATDMGMVVCAAAGNAAHSTPKVSALLHAQVPAAFPNVIAVSACNLSDQRAKYSQRGDIAAPGGEDLDRPGPDDTEDMYGLGVSVGTSGYVRMDGGTSFSTPLVAGAAALLLEGMTVRGEQTYSQVLSALQAAARPAAGAGVETLQCCGLGAGVLYLPTLFG